MEPGESAHQDPETAADAHELDASHDAAGPAGGRGPDLAAAEEDAHAPPTPGHVDESLGHPAEEDEDAHVVHGGHDAHAAESSAWVLVPLLVGLVIGVIIVVALGIGSGG